MSTVNPYLSVISPVYNEEEIVQAFCKRMLTTLEQMNVTFELILINDGSRDNSLTLMKQIAEGDSRIKYISFTRNFGHQNAVYSGLTYANGDTIVVIDSDLQDPPELIVELHEKLKEGVDVVVAQRKKREGESKFKLLTAKMYYRLFSKMVSFQLPLDVGDYRIMNRRVVKELLAMKDSNLFLRGQIAWLGYKTDAVLYNRDSRVAGETKYTLNKMLKLAFDGIFGFSSKPLNLLTRIGLLMFSCSILVIFYALISHFVLHRTISGWTSVIICVAFFSGFQTLSLGIMGEYIARLKDDNLARPHFVVDETNMS